MYRFAPVRWYKLAFYALVGRMGEIVLLLAGWDRRIRQTRWDGGELEGPELAGNGSGLSTLAFELRRTTGSGGYHHFHWCCRGARSICISAEK